MQKIKYFIESDKGKDVLTVIIIILVGTSSFGLGRLSKTSQNGQFKVIYPENSELGANAISALNEPKNGSSSVNLTSNTSTTEKNYVASSRGHKYYPVGCSAGDSLSESNKIYFATAEEAEKAGYTLSSSC